MEKVRTLLENLNISTYKDTLYENYVNGESLAACGSVEEVKDVGISNTIHSETVLYKG